MSKHEKHAHAAARQERDAQAKQADDDPLDELEGSEELLKTSFTAGNEMKIAVAVILVLVVVFAAAVVKWMRHSSSPASNSSADTAADNDDRGAAKSDKDASERQETSPFGSSSTSSKLTKVPAISGPSPELRPKSRANEPDTWTLPSDLKPQPAKTPDDRHSPLASSFGPRNRPGESNSRVDAGMDRSSPRPSFTGWQHDTETRGPAASRQPSDPFRSRSAADGLRGDSPGTAADTSKSVPRSDVGRPFQAASERPGRPSYGLADTSRTMPRSDELSAPSAGSRAPRTAGDPNPLRTPDLSVQDNAKKYSREDKLKPGDAVLPPAAAGSGKLYPESRPSPARRNPPESQPRTATAPSRPGAGRVYVVQAGDTVYDIARQELGKASRWREIYDLNKDVLGKQWLDPTPGMQIVLPDDGPGAVSQRQGIGSLR